VLRGESVGLRARQEEDVPLLKAGLYDDVATRLRADSRPWVPVSSTSDAVPYRVREPTDDAAMFSVVDLTDDDRLVGEALLWSIDLHNRSAHLGLALLRDHRGRSLGTDIVRVLCRYGFSVRGLHRLQLETLVDNVAMIAAAERVGFTREGVQRGAAWADGEFVDVVTMGLLAGEWSREP
jgi:RimJ/RimL family protein N-acetyltransferase